VGHVEPSRVATRIGLKHDDGCSWPRGGSRTEPRMASRATRAGHLRHVAVHQPARGQSADRTAVLGLQILPPKASQPMTLSEECAALAVEIQQLNAEHIASTGFDALHVGACSRADLHER